MNILERMQAPTPRFFRVLRAIGLAMVSAGGTLLTVSTGLPDSILVFASYATVAGAVMSAVSQVVVEDSNTSKNSSEEIEK